MNYIKHLTGFFDRVIHDADLNPTHVSLYIGLFQYWNVNRFQNPISITRDEVMRISKICSKSTYHKCMTELHAKGYLKYEPSFNPFKGSMVILFNFSEDLKPKLKKDSAAKKILQANGQVVDSSETGQQEATEQALVPSINTPNATNISNDLNLGSKNKKNKNGRKSADEETHPGVAPTKVPPTIDEVEKYFSESALPAIEAPRFFNYFSSNGWLVGGRTPMTDWQAAAQYWVSNSQKFHHEPKSHAANLSTGKNYAEPL